MTSPVDTSVKWFSSSMSGAPVLNGVAGSLVALLDALLKDGFDTKTGVSIVVASGVATASWSGSHSCDVDTVVQIAGVTGPLVGLNGEQKIATKAALGTSATWLTNEANGAATGTITMKMAPLGFLKPFAGTNKAVYKSADVASSGMLVRMDDTNTTWARVVGYEAMTDVDTGTNPFPLPATISGGGYWPKSTVASAAAVEWYVYGDGRVFFYNPVPGTPTSSLSRVGTIRGFGDAVPVKQSGDPYGCFLCYSASSAASTMYDGGLETNSGSVCAFPRAYTGIGSPVQHYANSYIGNSTSTEYSGTINNLGSFPADVDGGMYLSKKYFAPTGQKYVRAEVPGLYHIPQSLVFDTIKPGVKVPGTRDLTGRNLLAVPGSASSTSFGTASSSSNTAIAMVDTTGPWR